MAIKLTKANPNSGVSGYSIGIIGDGTSVTTDVDFYGQIAADASIHNKTPTGVFLVTADSGVAPSASLNGTVVTLTWSTAPAAGAYVNVGVLLTFNS